MSRTLQSPLIRGKPLFVILTRNASSNLFCMGSSQKVSKIREKSAFYRPLKNGQFIGVCTEKKGVRNIC